MTRADPEAHLTVVVPELASPGVTRHLLGQRKALLIKTGLLFEEDIAVIDLVYVTGSLRRGSAPGVEMPARHVAVVAVGNLGAPSRTAIAYATATHPDSLHIIHVDIDPERTARLRDQTRADGIHLEVLPSPYRSLTTPIVDYVRQRRDEGAPGTIVTMVIPEFIVAGLASGQSAAQPERPGIEGGSPPGARRGGGQRSLAPDSGGRIRRTHRTPGVVAE